MKSHLKTRFRLFRRVIRQFFSRKFSTRLILTYVALGAIPLITISIFLISITKDTAQTYIHQRNLETARRASNEIYLFIESPLTILQTTALTNDITQMERFSQSRLINKIKDENSLFRKIFILDTTGTVIVTTSFGEEMLDLSQEPYFAQAINGEQYLSDVYFTPSRFPVMLLAEPIRVYNQIVGVIAAEIDLKNIWDLADNIRIGRTGFAFLVSANGIVIAHREKEKVLDKVDYSGFEFFNNIKQNMQGVITIRIDDVNYLTAYAPVPELNWGVVIQQEEEEAFAFAQEMQVRVYIFVALTTIIAVLVGFLSVQRFTKPLLELVKGAREYAKGNLQHQIAIQRRDEIAELAEEFNSMAASLLKYQNDLKRMTRLAALSRFASMISHEIKNPLNSMNINMQILKRIIYKDHIPIDRKVKYLDVLSSEISRINELVNNFLTIARPPELSFHLNDIHQILDEVTIVQEGHALTEGVKIIRDYANGKILGMFDYNQLKQVFHNIIINAIDAMKEGGKLHISTKLIRSSRQKQQAEDNGYVQIKFTDTGTGISRNALKDVFEFYYTTKPTGTGLGLAIAKQIVEGHQGKISIESREGVGTSVSIQLPIKKYAVDSDQKLYQNSQ